MKQDHFFKPDYTPPAAFYFSVKFRGFPEMDTSIQEVSGLKVTVNTVERVEGGDNYYVHYLPSPPKYENLVLKRCLLYKSSLDKWCRDALEDFSFDPMDIQVALLGANGGILASWNIERAIPLSWELGVLNSTSNELAIETLTLKYRNFKREF